MPLSVFEKGTKGVCHFYSETGTEGGYWAFQDEQYIVRNRTCFVCAKCRAWWDSSRRDEPGIFSNSGTILAFLAATVRRGCWKSLFSALRNFFGKPLPEIACLLGQHDWKIYPEFLWSYAGLRMLRDGDELAIYDKNDPERVVWAGVISLRQHPVFSEHAYNFWIHADQAGIDRKTWARFFFKKYSAKLLVRQLPRKPRF